MTNAEQLTAQAVVTFIGVPFTAVETLVTYDVFMRLTRYIPDVADVKVYCSPRRADGWLEWSMHVTYKHGSTILIGVVSRVFGGETEFHS